MKPEIKAIKGGEKSLFDLGKRRELYPQVLAAIKGVKEDEALTSKEIAKLINIDFKKRDNSAYWHLMGALDDLSRATKPSYTGERLGLGRIGRRNDLEKKAFVYFDPETSHNN